MACQANRVIDDAAASPAAENLNTLEKRLLNDFQHNFPLTPRPYASIAEALGTSESDVMTTLRGFQQQGLVTRVGPVFRPNRVGRSTLAAMAVPEGRLEKVAELVNGYDEVNHNYEREHRFNLWFVATAADQQQLDATLADIERRSGIEVMSLPMLEPYHLDLGFSIDWSKGTTDRGTGKKRASENFSNTHRTADRLPRERIHRDETDERLIAAIQQGLPLTSRPYVEIAQRTGMVESEVIQCIDGWLADGTISRMGVVVRHRELGYRANAMVVWDVPDEFVAQLGRCFSEFDFVTLCYRRPRRLPQWRYNLFCMIHGQSRDAVLERVEQLVRQCGDAPIAHQVLFSRRRFKQRGARYHSDKGCTANHRHTPLNAARHSSL